MTVAQSTFVPALKIVISLTTAFTMGVVHADTQEDYGLWLMALAHGSVGNEGSDPSRVKLWVDVQTRFSGHADGFSQAIVQPRIGVCRHGKSDCLAGLRVVPDVTAVWWQCR